VRQCGGAKNTGSVFVSVSLELAKAIAFATHRPLIPTGRAPKGPGSRGQRHRVNSSAAGGGEAVPRLFPPE